LGWNLNDFSSTERERKVLVGLRPSAACYDAPSLSKP
jgi:hypothetical protein